MTTLRSRFSALFPGCREIVWESLVLQISHSFYKLVITLGLYYLSFYYRLGGGKTTLVILGS